MHQFWPKIHVGFENVNKADPVATLDLGSHNDINDNNIHTNFLKPLFWALETLKRTFSLKSQRPIITITKSICA